MLLFTNVAIYLCCLIYTLSKHKNNINAWGWYNFFGGLFSKLRQNLRQFVVVLEAWFALDPFD